MFNYLINSIFGGNSLPDASNPLLEQRLDILKTNSYSHLDSKGFAEFLLTGKSTSYIAMFGFNSFVENYFEKTSRSEIGDLIVIRSVENPHHIFFEGVVTKREKNTNYVTTKSGSGPYALIETVPQKEFLDHVFKGRYHEIYRPKKDFASTPVSVDGFIDRYVA